MTDIWADTSACMEIGINADGEGPVVPIEDAVETICWVCLTPWPCTRSTAEGAPNIEQVRNRLAEAMGLPVEAITPIPGSNPHEVAAAEGKRLMGELAARGLAEAIPEHWDHFAVTVVDETLCWRCMTTWPCPVVNATPEES